MRLKRGHVDLPSSPCVERQQDRLSKGATRRLSSRRRGRGLRWSRGGLSRLGHGLWWARGASDMRWEQKLWRVCAQKARRQGRGENRT